MQVEVLKKFLGILENQPPKLLSSLPGFDPEVYQRLKSLNNNVSARIRQTERKLLQESGEVVVIDDIDIDSNGSSSSGDFPKSSFKMKKPHSLENKSPIELAPKVESEFFGKKYEEDDEDEIMPIDRDKLRSRSIVFNDSEGKLIF